MSDPKSEKELKGLRQRVDALEESVKRLTASADELAGRLTAESKALDQKVRQALQQERGARDEAVSKAVGELRGDVSDNIVEESAARGADIRAVLREAFQKAVSDL